MRMARGVEQNGNRRIRNAEEKVVIAMDQGPHAVVHVSNISRESSRVRVKQRPHIDRSLSLGFPTRRS